MRLHKSLLDELADKVATDRVMRTLASYHLVKEVDVDSFGATPFSNSMADQTWKDALGLMQVRRLGYGHSANDHEGCRTVQTPIWERQSTSKRETIGGPTVH